VTNLRLSALALLLASAPALAQFEGVVDMKMTMREGSGTGKAFISKAASRSEIDIRAPKMEGAGRPAGFKMVMIQKLAQPNVVYSINDEQKTYAVIDTKKMREGLPKDKEPKYAVKRIGSDSVSGYGCEKVLITNDKAPTQETEACIAKDILGSSAWYQAMSRNQDGSASMFKAMKDAGVEGFPVRMVMREKGKSEPNATMEIVKVEKRALPASLFEIPPGYSETSMMGTMMTPESAKQMEEMMKKLTPEQRKQIEEMMKKKGGS
jgi:hypothetical protein